jgi:glycosyltransferase involved in cell wall biosynthesis
VRWIHRRADLVIVTNETLGHVVRAQGADAAVLPDGLPNITQAPREAVAEEQSVLLICSYAEDEPYGEVFSAAEELGGEAKVYVTGKYKKVGLTPEDVPKNVVLLGYVSDAEFLEFVKSVKVAVDLTTRDDCLVRGAYEALAAGTPFVVSDTPVLRELFEGAAIFCRNDRRSIAEAIHTALAENREYRDRVLQTREDYRERWSEQAKALRDRLGSA